MVGDPRRPWDTQEFRAPDDLTEMRERVAELGGVLGIEPHDPRGTRIDARLPLGVLPGAQE
jgi:signal transduction histidine kinase